MERKIIHIDEEKCNGCGACAAACHEGAIAMINGKAHLIRDDYCDGLGDCLPTCPTGAITFVVREAAAYDEAAVLAKKKAAGDACPSAGCPGVKSQSIRHDQSAVPAGSDDFRPSCLAQWPCQIKLAPINAPYFDGADILIAADCTAYTYAAFHEKFMRGKITLVGCPKLDDVDYSEKLTEIFTANDIRSVTLVRMEVPCCGGMERAVKAAIENSGKQLDLPVHTVSIKGELLDTGKPKGKLNLRDLARQLMGRTPS